jgi:hypothetical protein
MSVTIRTMAVSNTKTRGARPMTGLVAILLAVAGCAGPSPSLPAVTRTPTPSIAATAAPTDEPGASAPTPLEDPPLAIELVAGGYTGFPDEAGGFASYGAILRNPNTGWSVQRAEVKIDFLDASGAFIAGEEVVVTILPGQETAIGGQASGAAEASQMDVQLPDDLTAFVPRATTNEGFDVTDIVWTGNGARGWLTTGELTSRFATPQSFVQVVAIHRDEAGSIVGGAGGGIQDIAPGGSAKFEIVDTSPYTDIMQTDIYWQVTR